MLCPIPPEVTDPFVESYYKNFMGAEAKPGRRKISEVRIRGNAAQCLALSRLRVGTLLSNRIKNFAGADVKPERR